MGASASQTVNGPQDGIFQKSFDFARRIAGDWTQPDAGEETRSGAQALESANEGTFRIFVLGTSGAGKTTFLASMYNRMSVQHPDVGFYLDVSEEQRKVLTKKYRQLADPERDWPAATLRSEVSEWTFRCTHYGRSAPVHVFNVSYLDYAGETITELLDEDHFEPGREAQDADSVLVLLDGHKVLRHMDGAADPYLESLHHDLDDLLPIVQKLHAKPVHFAVSKWDVVDGRYSLWDIRRALMRHERFKLIVNQRRERGVPIRLIPMSAIGSGFAEIDDEGVMVKRRDAMAPSPYQVEMSIACTLIDAFQAAAKQLDERERQILLNPRRFMNVPYSVGRSAIWALKHVARAVPGQSQFDIGTVALTALLTALDEKLAERGENLKEEIEGALAQVESESAAVDTVILKTLLLLKTLDAKFPCSNLLHS